MFFFLFFALGPFFALSLPTQSPFSIDDAQVSSESVIPIWFSPNAPPSTPLVAAYYADWTSEQLPPESVDFNRFDWIDFAFAVPDPETYTPTFAEESTGDVLARLVSIAHANSKFVKLSIGGWTGSAHFSDAVNSQNRPKFVASIVALYREYALDGIDIDWEYPAESGAPGNTQSPSDALNFLATLQLLRAQLPPVAKISAATQVWPFTDATGQHMEDVSQFAHVLDWITIMNYDVWNSSPNPGPNAPLSNACHNSSQPEANAHAAIISWTQAGFPAHQIMLGLPAYGYVSRSAVERLRTRSSVSDTRRTDVNPHHRREDPGNDIASSSFDAAFDLLPIGTTGTTTITDIVTTTVIGPEMPTLATTDAPSTSPSVFAPIMATSDSGGTDSGQVDFSSLVKQGVLARNKDGATPMFVGSGGFIREWDNCSSTPFLRSVSTHQIITYDDPESLAMKGTFVKQSGLLGVNFWDAHGDTAEWDLVDAVRKGMGVVS